MIGFGHGEAGGPERLDKGIGIDLLSDQTSCHAAYDGGYCPAGITFEERTRLLKEDPARYRALASKIGRASCRERV